MELFTQRFKSGRLMRGYSLQDLADNFPKKITKQALSRYEKGEIAPTEEFIGFLSQALSVYPSFFSRPRKVKLSKIEFRKLEKFPLKESEQVINQTEYYLERYLEVEELLNIRTPFINPIKGFVINSDDDIDIAADLVRKHWGLGTMPLTNTSELVESHGVKVMEVNVNLDFNGLSSWVDSNTPVIVVNSSLDEFLDRKRFTMMHELGHLLLESIDDKPHKEKERICNYFAGAILFPKSEIVKELGAKRTNISFPELASIKLKYGISFQAIMYRANNLRIISDSRLRQFMYMMGQLNYKIHEPVKYAGLEKSYRFYQLVNKAKAQRIVDPKHAAEIANVELKHFSENQFFLEK